jgi:hypothetical protein
VWWLVPAQLISFWCSSSWPLLPQCEPSLSSDSPLLRLVSMQHQTGSSTVTVLVPPSVVLTLIAPASA